EAPGRRHAELPGVQGVRADGLDAAEPGVHRMNRPLDPRVSLGRRDAMRAGRSVMFTERMSRERVNAGERPEEIPPPAAATDTVVWDVQVTSKLLSTGLHEGKILWPDATLTPVEWNEPEGWIIDRSGSGSGSGSGLGIGEIWILPLPGRPLKVGDRGP